jgi:hypothetical protein
MTHFKAGDVEVRDAVGSDVALLKDRLRRKDAEEVLALGAGSIEDELAQSFAQSRQRYTIERGGVPLAMFGILPETILGDRAVVWLLGTDDLAKIKKTFVRGTGLFLRKFLEEYPILFNFVPADYTQTIRWLEAFGARFDAPEPVGRRGEMIRRFVIGRF